jgi:hypothetical protein
VLTGDGYSVPYCPIHLLYDRYLTVLSIAALCAFS